MTKPVDGVVLEPHVPRSLIVRRHSAVAAGGLLILLTLTGCEGAFFQGPISLRQSATGLEIGVCADIEVERISASYRPLVLFRTWTEFWSAEGLVTVRDGATIAVNDPLVGMATTVGGSPDLNPGDEVDVVLYGIRPDGMRNVSAVLVIPQDGLSETTWLQSDGRVTQGVCS